MPLKGFQSYFEIAALLFCYIVLCSQINGRKATLPGKVGEHISLSNSGRSVTIQLKSAVQVTYSISQVVTVRVKSNLMGKMCGACGNYNEDSKDDMTTSDGKTTKDVSVVVSSWSAGDFSQW